MALDAGIYNLIGKGVTSFNDYQDQDIGLQGKRINLLGLQQAQADDTALREATKQMGTDAMANRDLIARTGNWKGLLAHDKAQQERQESQSKIGLQSAQTGHHNAQTGEIDFKQQMERRQRHLGELAGISDLAGAQQWLTDAVKSGELPFDRANQALVGLQQNPASLNEWKEKARLGGLTLLQQMEQQRHQQDFGLKNANEYMTGDGKGGYALNTPLIDAKKHVAKAGASNVSVKVDAKLGEGVAAQVGPMIRDSYEGAQAAAQAVDTADRLLKAVDTDKVYTGPGASWRLKGAQLAATMGIAGKDTEAKIANTRATIQGLAQSSLDARGKLKGQGAISEGEGALLQRAVSGDIDNFTAAEIKQVAAIGQRLNRKVVEVHGNRVKKLAENPTTKDLATFYQDDAPKVVDFGSLK